jgi:hypothetical protein
MFQQIYVTIVSNNQRGNYYNQQVYSGILNCNFECGFFSNLENQMIFKFNIFASEYLYNNVVLSR